MKRLTALICLVLAVAFLNFPVSAAGAGDLVMSNCDSTKDWSASTQGMDALESDANNKTEGAGSIGATAMNGKLNQICYKPEKSIDITDFRYLEFDIYFTNITWFNDCGSVMMELTSSGTSDKESNRYMKKTLRELFETGAIEDQQNWFHFVLDIDNPQGEANGGLDKANFNYFRFYSVDPITSTPDYTVRFDNFRFTNNPSNYTPIAEEEETGNQAAESEIYVPKHSDPNKGVDKELNKKLQTEYTVAIAVAVVLLLLIIRFVVVLIIRIKRNKSEGAK